MGKNTKEYNLLKEKLEKCLLNLKYNYSLADIDDDINFFIFFDASKKFKSLESIKGLLYVDEKAGSITLLVVNIYSINKKDDISIYYKMVNDINSVLPHGRFTINETFNQIVYSSTINCGKNFEELNEQKIQILVDCFLNNLQKLIALLAEV